MKLAPIAPSSPGVDKAWEDFNKHTRNDALNELISFCQNGRGPATSKVAQTISRHYLNNIASLIYAKHPWPCSGLCFPSPAKYTVIKANVWVDFQ